MLAVESPDNADEILFYAVQSGDGDFAERVRQGLNEAADKRT